MTMEKISDMVEVALMTNSEARDDDFILYEMICRKVNPLTTSMDFGTLMHNHTKFGLPALESVTRARRYIQHNNPELRPSPNASGNRYKHWKEVKEWSVK